MADVLQILGTYDDYLAAMDTLSHASRHLASQYSDLMSRPVAAVHFGARQILIDAGVRLQHEASAIFNLDGRLLGKSEVE